MLQHCLSREEISRFLEIQLTESNLYEDEVDLRNLFELWHTWDAELICLTNLLSIALERRQKTSADSHTILKKLYALRDIEGMNLTIDELDEGFVAFMLSSPRSNSFSLEEELIEIRQQLSEYKFIR